MKYYGKITNDKDLVTKEFVEGKVDGLETSENKVTSIGPSSTDTQYPSAKAVADAIENIDALPSQSGQSGKFLTTNGTDASWGIVEALPAQVDQNGKFLTTNGTTASWSTIITYEEVE